MGTEEVQLQRGAGVRRCRPRPCGWRRSAAAPRAGGPCVSSAAESRSVCAATTLSSANPCTSSSGRAWSGPVTGSAASSTSEWWRVDVHAVLGQAQVALGVRGVVQRPVGDRRAGDRRTGTAPGGAAPPTRPASRRTTSRAPPPGPGPGRGACRRARSARRPGRSGSRRPSAGGSPSRTTGATPGVPRLSMVTTAKPGVGPPLPLQPGRPGGHHLLVARAAVDVQQHRQPAARHVVCPGRAPPPAAAGR